MVQVRAEPPSKSGGGKQGTDEPSLGENEAKSKELAQAAKDAEQFKADRAAEAKAAAEAAKAAADAKAAQDKADEIKRNTRPDGTLHMNGQRFFPDGSVVKGVNVI